MAEPVVLAALLTVAAVARLATGGVAGELTLVAAPPPHRKGIEVAATACGCYKTPVTATRRLWPCFAGGVKGSHGKHTHAR